MSHPAVVPAAQFVGYGSGGLLLIQDSDHRASWSQLGPGDHLQGLGGRGQLNFRHRLKSFVLMKTTVIRSAMDILSNSKK